MSRQTNSRKKLLLIAAAAITIIIIAAAIVTVLLLKKPEENDESKRSRSRRIKVIGFSMEPAIKDGDIIKITDDLSDLDCGDIVVYNNDKAWIYRHRKHGRGHHQGHQRKARQHRGIRV